MARKTAKTVVGEERVGDVFGKATTWKGDMESLDQAMLTFGRTAGVAGDQPKEPPKGIAKINPFAWIEYLTS